MRYISTPHHPTGIPCAETNSQVRTESKEQISKDHTNLKMSFSVKGKTAIVTGAGSGRLESNLYPAS